VRMRFCIHCRRHYEIGTGVRNRCGDCGRALDRQMSKPKRARRTRNSAAWQKARAAARERDGQRCTNCGSAQDLEVHQIVPLSKGGEQFALSNLTTLCRDCHSRESHDAVTPRPRFSRNKLYPPWGEGDTATAATHPGTSNPRNKLANRLVESKVDDKGPLIG
jgi:5-methylcytosine-specific restriction endonuclease McrA